MLSTVQYCRAPFLQPPSLNTMIFPTGWHHGQDVILATLLATLWPTQGQALHQHAMGNTALACFDQISWIDCQGVQQAWWWQSNVVNGDSNNGNCDGSGANNKDGGNDGNNDEEVTWMAMAVATTTTTTITLSTTTATMGHQQCDGNNNNGMTMIWWWWAVSDVQNTCESCATYPRQQSTYVNSLGRSRQERGTILGDGRTEKGQGGSNLVEITSSPLDQFQINFLHTPEWRSHVILFCMCPGSKAVLLVPWWACLMTMRKRTVGCQLVSLLGGGSGPRSFHLDKNLLRQTISLERSC